MFHNVLQQLMKNFIFKFGCSNISPICSFIKERKLWFRQSRYQNWTWKGSLRSLGFSEPDDPSLGSCLNWDTSIDHFLSKVWWSWRSLNFSRRWILCSVLAAWGIIASEKSYQNCACYHIQQPQQDPSQLVNMLADISYFVCQLKRADLFLSSLPFPSWLFLSTVCSNQLLTRVRQHPLLSWWKQGSRMTSLCRRNWKRR